ncbi:hypothetical protein D2Q93_15705 [Alicyclobacillaceae bacterium I2511]|nr:hypothetical protein D2Q93_15705 [Alicyclobacillaceae bacterium I2511]
MKNSELRRSVETDLRQKISAAKRIGEFQLAPVVQDSLLVTLTPFRGSPQLMNIAHFATQTAVKTAVVQHDSTPFTVVAAVRGSMHAMLNLSGHPMPSAIAVATGGLSALHSLELGRPEAYRKAVVSGIRTAVEELGMDWEFLRAVIVHLAKYYPDQTPQPLRPVDGPEQQISYA